MHPIIHHRRKVVATEPPQTDRHSCFQYLKLSVMIFLNQEKGNPVIFTINLRVWNRNTYRRSGLMTPAVNFSAPESHGVFTGVSFRHWFLAIRKTTITHHMKLTHFIFKISINSHSPHSLATECVAKVLIFLGFFGHIQWCSGLTPCSVLRNCSWWGSYGVLVARSCASWVP